MRSSKESRAFQDAAWRFRRIIIDEYTGPRLNAAIRASQAFIPRAFWSACLDNRDEMLAFYETEIAAIHRRDADAARAACVERAEAMARIMVAELVRRRVLPPTGASVAV
jgi:DNA-binding GntR family transcriptional regulator